MPPDGVSVGVVVVAGLPVVVLYRLLGDADAANGVRVISTFTSTVFVAAALSVTVQRKTAVYVVLDAKLVPVKVVVAADAESAAIDVEPERRVQA